MKVLKRCMCLKPPLLSSVIWIRFLWLFEFSFFEVRNVGGNYFNVFILKLLGGGVDVASFTRSQIPQKHEYNP